MLSHFQSRSLIFHNKNLAYSAVALTLLIPYSPVVIIIILIIIISNLSHDRSTASSTTIPPLNAIWSFLLQMRVISPVPKIIQQLLTSSSSSSCHFYLSLYLSFNNLFQKAFSTQDVTCHTNSKYGRGKRRL